MKGKKVASVNAIYAGGGFWLFCGKTTDNNFFMVDDMGCVLVLGADPMADLETACFEDWQRMHKLSEPSGSARVRFCMEMLDKLSTYKYGSEENGGITAEEIERYRKSMVNEF